MCAMTWGALNAFTRICHNDTAQQFPLCSRTTAAAPRGQQRQQQQRGKVAAFGDRSGGGQCKREQSQSWAGIRGYPFAVSVPGARRQKKYF
jgi:hypothetical protein